MRPLRHRTEPYRWAVVFGALGCAAAWGLVEFVALQRLRYHLWRERRQTPAHR